MLSVHDTVSEWLRRWTRNPLGSARRGSNPLGVDVAASVPQYVCVISYKHVSRQLRRCGPCCNNQRTQESATKRRSIMTREREREGERERERERRRHSDPRCQTADVYGGGRGGVCCARAVGATAALLPLPQLYSLRWHRARGRHDSLAEWSKALASGASPQGRGFEPHSCQFSDGPRSDPV
jgi:hypothetical protein